MMTGSAIEDTDVGFCTTAWTGRLCSTSGDGGVLRALVMTAVIFSDACHEAPAGVALAIEDDRIRSRGGVTGQGDRHLHTHGTLGTLGTHGTHRTHGTHTRESGAGWCVSHMGVTHTQIPVTVTQPQQHLNPHT